MCRKSGADKSKVIEHRLSPYKLSDLWGGWTRGSFLKEGADTDHGGWTLRIDERKDKGVPLGSDSSRDKQRYGEEMADPRRREGGLHQRPMWRVLRSHAHKRHCSSRETMQWLWCLRKRLCGLNWELQMQGGQQGVTKITWMGSICLGRNGWQYNHR